ncbi:MAG: Eco57I restriction-modification methylase domain-containing protein [Actinobacteria bacterium]|nr:Eco57I restriction-modification methylase domain-containing protein [Actinomycetota bacterium]
MTEQVTFSLRSRNPDVLTCIANLSNDEVFTPPELAAEMLDLVADAWAGTHDEASMWADRSVTFLDPFTKSGVFLREITKRLTEGLAADIPDLQERVDHILTKQVFGIGITQLTAMLARRSVYCSKFANGEHSVASSFTTAAGNIWFEPMEHTWAGATEFVETADGNGNPIRRGTNGRCSYCGAAQTTLDRGAGLESHAYAFIHTDDINARIAELFGADMQFDVIIGNPPYQLQSDGGTRDIPIYQHFVEQAKRLAPRYLAMVIPSRWMASGLGLTEFRRTMLADTHIRELVDYPNAAEVFPSVGINGGACYFLWDASHDGACNVTTVRAGETIGPMTRALDEFDVLVRDARALTILRKVLEKDEPSVNTILARDKEFGWTSNFDRFHDTERPGDVALYYIRSMKRDKGFIEREAVTKSAHLVDTWKLLVPKVGSGRERERSGVDLVLGPPLVAPSPSVCTQSFLFFYLDSEDQVRSVKSYYATRFFRFLVSLRKITQDATHSTYTWVPMQAWDRTWTDADLYDKYGITADEIAFIEAMIRPMDLSDG